MSMEYFTDEVVYSSQAELTAFLNARARERWRLVHVDRVCEWGATVAWVVFERKALPSKPRPSWERQRVPGTAGTWHAFEYDEETGECRVCMDEEASPG